MSNVPQMTRSTKKNIGLYFNGDDSNSVYEYRSGSALIEMYTNRFGTPNLLSSFSRWTFCEDTIDFMFQNGRINEFFSTMLSLRNVSKELHETNHAACAVRRKEAIEYINKLLLADDLELLELGDQLILHRIDDASDLIGSGGFANVYIVPGTNMVVKKLRDEYKGNDGIVSRFKNEFHLIKDKLQGIEGIIESYEYNPDEISYTMEYCSSDLKRYIANNNLNEEARISLVMEILHIMRDVHERKVWHRDLSPKNIFIKNGHPVIADFGLGKAIDDNGRTYMTIDTSMNGTLEYCDPRQFQGLGFADGQSDIYSLGRIINYVMTGNSDNFKHALSLVSTIATESSLDARYHSVQEMISKIERLQQSRKDSAYAAKCEQYIERGVYDKRLDEYLFSFEEDGLIEKLNSVQFRRVYTSAATVASNNAIVLERFTELRDVFANPIGHPFAKFDAVSRFCVDMLRDHKEIQHSLKVTLGECIYYITVEVTRWGAQSYFRKNMKFLEEEYVQDTIKASKDW